MHVPNAKNEWHMASMLPLECGPPAMWAQFGPTRIVQCGLGHQTSPLPSIARPVQTIATPPHWGWHATQDPLGVTPEKKEAQMDWQARKLKAWAAFGAW